MIPRNGLLGEILPPSANYELSGQKFCIVQGFVSLLLLMLWFDFDEVSTLSGGGYSVTT